MPNLTAHGTPPSLFGISDSLPGYAPPRLNYYTRGNVHRINAVNLPILPCQYVEYMYCPTDFYRYIILPCCLAETT